MGFEGQLHAKVAAPRPIPVIKQLLREAKAAKDNDQQAIDDLLDELSLAADAVAAISEGGQRGG